jgi:ribosomal protein S18 acetylase RimI-like enzyme
MNDADLNIKIRPMSFLDLGDLFSVANKIQTTETSATYKKFTLQKLFGVSTKESGSEERPDILEVAKLIDLGLIAECNGSICGFVIGRQVYLAEFGVQEGEIAIIGVHPNYRRKGVAHELIKAINDLFASRGVRLVRIGVNPRDKELTAFFERAGFSGERVLFLSKTL